MSQKYFIAFNGQEKEGLVGDELWREIIRNNIPYHGLLGNKRIIRLYISYLFIYLFIYL